MDHIQRLTRLPPAPTRPGGSLVLLPPDEPEEDLPPRHWPEPPRTRWGGLALVGLVGTAALLAWTRLSSEPTATPPPMPAYAEGLGAMGADRAAAEQQELAIQPGPIPPADPGSAAVTAELQTAATGEDRPREVVTRPEVEPPQPAREGSEAGQDAETVAPGTGVERLEVPADAPDEGAAPGRTVAPAAQIRADTPATEVLEPPPVARTVVQDDTPRPAPARTESAPARAEAPPVDEAAAAATLRRGADRFATEIGRGGASGADGLRRMILASDAAANDLIAFVRQHQPSATIAGVGQPTIEGDLARVDARISYSWRGQFGVTRQGSSLVQVLARQVDGEWTVAGVQPMSGPPR